MAATKIPNRSPLIEWPEEGVARAPYRVFRDREIYEAEQQRIFRGPIWNYLALEVEIPDPGRYVATFVGDTPVVVVRDGDGGINAWVNRCAHRGALVCLAQRGREKSFSCAYHSWTYDLKGNLLDATFSQGINGKGGMPEDFNAKEHGLIKLRIDTINGLIFGTFDAETEPLEDYLGQAMADNIRRIFHKPIRILGTQKQTMPNNWKLYMENVKDPYHGSLLHVFFAAFGLNRLSHEGGIVMDPRGLHHISWARPPEGELETEFEKQGLRSVTAHYDLADPSLLEGRREFEGTEGVALQTIFPSLVVQQIQNSLALRQIRPKGPESMELVWTIVGFEDDDEELLEIRRRQANLIGGSGYISLEDGFIGGAIMRGTARDHDDGSFMEMGGKTAVAEDTDTRVTETVLRCFWKNYREMMGV